MFILIPCEYVVNWFLTWHLHWKFLLDKWHHISLHSKNNGHQKVSNACLLVQEFYVSSVSLDWWQLLWQLCAAMMTWLASHELKFFTKSKMDRHLLRQKLHQRISVMKTNTLYLSRKLIFWFTSCLEDNKNTSVCFHYWDSLMKFLT